MMLHDIASRLNLSRSRRGWRGRCPACGYEDAFILSEKDGHVRGRCVSCEDREAIHGLLSNLAEGGSPDVVDRRPTPREVPLAERIEKALRPWTGAVPLAGTAAATYLAGRGLAKHVDCPALRWRTDVRHPESDGLYPAMLALIQDANGQPQALHRHYLTRDGRKADLHPAKASSGPVRGGFVQLDDLGPEVAVGEGVESSASAGVLFSLPALAAISAGNLEFALDLPPEVRSVVIAADNDPIAPNGRRPGQWAAHAAARRWTAQGRKVRVAVPDREGVDFNDLLQERLGVVLHHG